MNFEFATFIAGNPYALDKFRIDYILPLQVVYLSNGKRKKLRIFIKKGDLKETNWYEFAEIYEIDGGYRRSSSVTANLDNNINSSIYVYVSATIYKRSGIAKEICFDISKIDFKTALTSTMTEGILLRNA
ncbi:MAG: hypothetical protein LBU60_03440 [Clostridiales bacterium]|jgi:hypothetical protein|nr:hypothetical protein [Clostridiales bacterium]